MITGVFINGIKLYGDISLTLDSLSTISLQGYNFDKLLNVVLSASSNTAFRNLTSINIFKRQPPISGTIVNYDVVDKNNLIVYLPELFGRSNIQLVPYNIAGYSESSRSLVTQTYSGNSTNITVYDATSSIYIRYGNQGIYYRPDGSSIYFRPDMSLPYTFFVDSDGYAFVDGSGNYLIV